MRLSAEELLETAASALGHGFRQAVVLGEHSFLLDETVYCYCGVGVQRQGELLTYLNEAGFIVPRLLYYDERLLLRDYIPGTPCGSDELDAVEGIPRLAALLAHNHDAGRTAPDLVVNPLDLSPSNLLCRDGGFMFWDWRKVAVEEPEEGFGRLFAAPCWDEGRCCRLLDEYVRCGQKELDRRLIVIIQQERRANPK